MDCTASRFAPGTNVTARGEQWYVSQAEPFHGCALITLDGAGAGNAGLRCRLITPFDTLSIVTPGTPRRRPRHATLRAALAAIGQARPARGLWTAAAAKMDLHSYQLEPALAALEGATRVLLADAVGLGKTIQAGLLLCELRARGLVDRALILTPAGLRDTWASELRERFDLRPTVFDQSTIAATVAGRQAGFNPWTAPGILIASIDLVKRPEVLAAVEESPFDMLIADEAHHLTPGSDRGAVIDRLAARAAWVILVSATPHSGDQAAFDYLTQLGACGDRVAVFRRTRADAGLTAGRRVHLLSVTPSVAEARMLHGTESYAKAIWQGRGEHDRGARLVAIILARRAASSATALERTLTRRWLLLSGRAGPAPFQPSLPWEDLDEADHRAPEHLLSLAGLADQTEELHLLEWLIAAATEARTHPSKLLRIARLVSVAREPAVIFSEYRDTLEALAAALAGAVTMATLHGGLPAPRRHEIVCAFNRGDIDVLLATDTAGEGLNLHHRCRLVIDVELPWNPLRLEQRIGRVDRLGQRRRVHAVRLLHRGTIEDTVQAHLERRRARAGVAMDLEPEEWLSEEDVAAAALGAGELPRRATPRLTSVVVGSVASEIERLARQRLVTGQRHVGPPARAAWSVPRHQAQAATPMVLLYGLQHAGPQGRLAEESCFAITAHVRGGARTRRDWRAWVTAVDAHPAVRAVLNNEGSKRLADIECTLQPFRLSVRRRVQRILDELRHSSRREQQSSLFDHRVERLAAIRQHVVDRLEAALLHRLQSVTPAPPASAPRVRLIAAWPLER